MEKLKEDKLAERKKKIDNFVQKYADFFDKIDKDLKTKIKNSKAHEIRKGISDKLYSAFDVVLVFCFGCIEANKQTNCITEVMFDEAVDISKNLDEYIKLNEKLIGSLHGIPFSIKDTFDVKDFGIIALM